MRMPFGKYKGRELRDVPDSYLLWLLDNCEDISPTLREAIERHLDGGNRNLPVEKALVDQWYGRLAREFHPDCGGSHDAMKAVNRAKDLLVEMAGVA